MGVQTNADAATYTVCSLREIYMIRQFRPGKENFLLDEFLASLKNAARGELWITRHTEEYLRIEYRNDDSSFV